MPIGSEIWVGEQVFNFNNREYRNVKKVLDVGNCPPDYASIKNMIEKHFDATVEQAHGNEDTLEKLKSDTYDLVLINRKLDRDYSDGVEILKQIKREAAISDTPVMIVTNYEEHQVAAIAEGAERGFGKLAIHAPDTIERLTPYLG